jgi:hypothetical protein
LVKFNSGVVADSGFIKGAELFMGLQGCGFVSGMGLERGRILMSRTGL